MTQQEEEQLDRDERDQRERDAATEEWYDEREREWSLRDDGRNPDGTGESFAERNL